MTTYKINKAERVNSKASKNNIKWRFGGKITDYKKEIKAFENLEGFYGGRNGYIGLRITNCETNEVIYENIIEDI